MKLKDMAKHIPVYQYVRICEKMIIQDMGYFGKTSALEQHLHKTVGLIRISDGVLEINVYEK